MTCNSVCAKGGGENMGLIAGVNISSAVNHFAL